MSLSTARSNHLVNWISNGFISEKRLKSSDVSSSQLQQHQHQRQRRKSSSSNHHNNSSHQESATTTTDRLQATTPPICRPRKTRPAWSTACHNWRRHRSPLTIIISTTTIKDSRSTTMSSITTLDLTTLDRYHTLITDTDHSTLLVPTEAVRHPARFTPAYLNTHPSWAYSHHNKLDRLNP